MPFVRQTIGQAGIVKSVVKSRHVAKVEVTGGSWTYNLDVLRFVTKGGKPNSGSIPLLHKNTVKFYLFITVSSSTTMSLISNPNKSDALQTRENIRNSIKLNYLEIIRISGKTIEPFCKSVLLFVFSPEDLFAAVMKKKLVSMLGV